MPTKIHYSKRVITLVLTSLPEDLVESFGVGCSGPNFDEPYPLLSVSLSGLECGCSLCVFPTAGSVLGLSAQHGSFGVGQFGAAWEVSKGGFQGKGGWGYHLSLPLSFFGRPTDT